MSALLGVTNWSKTTKNIILISVAAHLTYQTLHETDNPCHPEINKTISAIIFKRVMINENVFAVNIVTLMFMYRMKVVTCEERFYIHSGNFYILQK